MIDRNPMDRINGLHVVQQEPDPFTPEERDRLLAVMDGQIYTFLNLRSGPAFGPVN